MKLDWENCQGARGIARDTREWSANSGRLYYCPPTFADSPQPKRPRVVKSSMSHPHAPASLKQTPYLKAQRAVFGAPQEREFTLPTKTNGVRVDGLKELFGI
jgi:hypothetical protein